MVNQVLSLQNTHTVFIYCSVGKRVVHKCSEDIYLGVSYDDLSRLSLIHNMSNIYISRIWHVYHSSQIVDTTGPETTTSPTLPPLSSVTMSPVSRSRFQTTTVLLF